MSAALYVRKHVRHACFAALWFLESRGPWSFRGSQEYSRISSCKVSLVHTR